MPDVGGVQTGGASSAGVDPASGSDRWESILSSGIAETGVDPNASFADDGDSSSSDPANETPQRESSGSSATSSVATPPAATPGDDGARPQSVAGSPASPTAASSVADPSDPLASAGATPFTFDVDGQPRTIDGAFRIPGEGLYVPEAHVAQFQQIAQRAEQASTLERTHQDLTDRHATTLRQLDAFSTWPSRDSQGNPVTLTGPQGLEAQRVMLARSLATERVLTSVLEDPGRLLSLLGQDDAGNIVLNPQGREHLDALLRAERGDAISKTKEHFAGLVRTASTPPPPPAPTAASFADVTVNAFIARYKVDGLTDADRQMLVAEFPRYVQMDANGVPKDVDPRFLAIMQDRAQLRHDAQQAATAAEAAGKFNGGMARGRQAAKPAPRSVPTPAKPATAQKVGRAEQWDSVLQNAMQEIVV